MSIKESSMKKEIDRFNQLDKPYIIFTNQIQYINKESVFYCKTNRFEFFQG